MRQEPFFFLFPFCFFFRLYKVCWFRYSCIGGDLRYTYSYLAASKCSCMLINKDSKRADFAGGSTRRLFNVMGNRMLSLYVHRRRQRNPKFDVYFVCLTVEGSLGLKQARSLVTLDFTQSRVNSFGWIELKKLISSPYSTIRIRCI